MKAMRTTYTRCLQRAAYVVGGADKLCKHLNVSEEELIHWLIGTAEIPEATFLRAVDIVVEDQMKWISGKYAALKNVRQL